ncbi:MAG: penicillin-binding protein 2 [Anaplasmataceae bacterium]|nr:penicillin-binding protein 2 [Anaplasmataceae bacterium]
MNQKDLEKFSFDEVVGDELGDLASVEVPLHERIFTITAGLVLLVVTIAGIRVLMIGPRLHDDYIARAESNLKARQIAFAPRGLIVDRYGIPLAENRASYLAVLPIREYIDRQERGEVSIFSEIETILNVSSTYIEEAVRDAVANEKTEVVLVADLSEEQIISLKTLGDNPLEVRPGLRRFYPQGEAISSVVGYIGRVDENDLQRNPELKNYISSGKAGIEAYYNNELRGKNGYTLSRRNSRGEKLSDAEIIDPETGKTVQLTIDAEFQEYFHNRLRSGLDSLGRVAGVGVALNPQNGEVLALVSLPGYDNNLLSSSGNSEAKLEILTSSNQPLFNRVISGYYSPGSTIKPLVALAALVEGVITPDRHIYSPGYLDIPNPYDPKNPSRFLDWRPQGYVNVVSALAQSSNVYFYVVGGGFGDINGLGISRLLKWWSDAGFGKVTGIDLPGEESGKLPDIIESETIHGRPWLLGDTYNVSIGQGDLLVTPLQLVSYIAAIGNGGKIYQPHLRLGTTTTIIGDLSKNTEAMDWVRKGMESAVKDELGTALLLNSLPVDVGGKTGTAQTKNKAEENAFFVGFAPYDKPEIAILVLVENARQGSLNAVPVAKDVLGWYAENRLLQNKEVSSSPEEN